MQRRQCLRSKLWYPNRMAKHYLVTAEVLKMFKDPEGYEIYYQVLTGKLKRGGSVLDGLKDKKSLEKMGVEAAIGFVPFGRHRDGRLRLSQTVRYCEFDR